MRQKLNYNNFKPNDYLPIQDGENIVRILSEGAIVTVYYMSTRQRRYIPLGEDPSKIDPKVKHMVQSKRQYRWVAMNRTTQQTGILQKGNMIAEQVVQVAQEYGDPRKYDLKIVRSGKGMQTEYHVSKMPESKEFSPQESKDAKKANEYLKSYIEIDE